MKKKKKYVSIYSRNNGLFILHFNVMSIVMLFLCINVL